MKESSLWAEDRSTSGDTRLFVGDVISDKEYNTKYPTIHHLICELMEDKSYHDPRLVYMACSYILSHRGHFLTEVDENNVKSVTDFEAIYNDFVGWFDSNEIDRPWNVEFKDFGNVLKTKCLVSKKEKLFVELLFDGKKPSKASDGDNLSIKDLVAFISGKSVKLSDLFNREEYTEIDVASIKVSDTNFDENLDLLVSVIDDSESDLLTKIKRMNDWAVLVDILAGEQYISKSKVNIYDTHRKDIKELKYLTHKYLPKQYNAVFRDINKTPNYASYSYNCKNLGKNQSIPADYQMCSQEEFCKYISKILDEIDAVDEGDQLLLDEIKDRLSNYDFCPKQVTNDNRVIPYQLYYTELKTILDNASDYLEFLNETDEYGSVKDKILSIMKFRIPYFVGPLNNNSQFAWIERKNTGKLAPWNFEESVDFDKSEENFIRRMTAKCTYLMGEDVLPKYSLVYAKFCVLNEINNIRVAGVQITPEAKQLIYEELFMKHRKVTVKAIRDILIANQYSNRSDVIDGIDSTIKSELKAYHDFKEFILNGTLSEGAVESIILRITLTNDKIRLKKWLIQEFGLSESDAKKISKFKYSDFGKLSNRFLTEVYDIDKATGELKSEDNIINRLWNSNSNLMQLLSSDYGYSDNIQLINSNYSKEHSLSLSEQLENMYISSSVRRPVLRTIEIIDELRHILKSDPQKVFVEMARGANESQRGKRTKSRRDQIKEFYSNYDKAEVAQLLSELDMKTEDQLRSEKLFLYFMQLGRCMYSGNPINIEELATKMYDIDHIWPQSKIKDDSTDNKVLVLSEFNGKKGDLYPIPQEWRSRMNAMWNSLHDKGLISNKKFERLIRTTRFTDEELASFISRQLVETRQSTKAIATILKSSIPNSDVVYVKAGLVADFRQTYKDDYFTLKCREVNDFHHAKDAYLNIVMGNIYDVKFTRNPINFVKSGSVYTLNLNKMLEHDVVVGNTVAWKANNDEWFNRVIAQLRKNNIRYVRYSYCQKGALFKSTPLRKGNGQAPRKSYLSDINKYGGYDAQNFTCYYLISYYKKGKKVTSLLAVPLSLITKLKKIEDIEEYCIKLGYINPQVLLDGRLIKTNSLWEIDGYRVHLSGKSGDSVWFKGGEQLIVGYRVEDYIKKIYKYIEKTKGNKQECPITKFDGLSVERNIELYNLLENKLCNTKYKTLMPTVVETLNNAECLFSELTVENQVKALANIVELFGCNSSVGKDLTLIGGAKSSGIQKMSMKLNRKRFSTMYIIDQSPTGLFERKTRNLLEL